MLRVAVHHPDGAVSAYRFGRVEDGVHNVHPLFGNMPMDKFMEELKRQAVKESPDCEIRVEHIVLDPQDPEQSIWVDEDEFDPDVHQRTRPGNQLESPPLETGVQVAAQSEGQVA